MQTFTAHRLHFQGEVQSEIELNEHQGSALRGAFYHALRNRFCAFADDRRIQCPDCALVHNCPVASLASTLMPEHHRGRNRPRPYTIQAPLPGSGHPVDQGDRITFRYRAGERLDFGLTLYADAIKLFPYVVLAITQFERDGLGRRVQQSDGRWQRGNLVIRDITAGNPLTGEEQAVMKTSDHLVNVSDVPITHAHIQQIPIPAPDACLRLQLLTPTRIISQKHLLKPHTFSFRPFLHRLIERLESLTEAFSSERLSLDVPILLAAAEQVQIVEHTLTWEEVSSYSTRRHRSSPVGGLVGSVILKAVDWEPFWPLLLWGQFVHVGKDAVKGNGMYRIKEA